MQVKYRQSYYIQDYSLHKLSKDVFLSSLGSHPTTNLSNAFFAVSIYLYCHINLMYILYQIPNLTTFSVHYHHGIESSDSCVPVIMFKLNNMKSTCRLFMYGVYL